MSKGIVGCRRLPGQRKPTLPVRFIRYNNVWVFGCEMLVEGPVLAPGEAGCGGWVECLEGEERGKEESGVVTEESK